MNILLPVLTIQESADFLSRATNTRYDISHLLRIAETGGLTLYWKPTLEALKRFDEKDLHVFNAVVDRVIAGKYLPLSSCDVSVLLERSEVFPQKPEHTAVITSHASDIQQLTREVLAEEHRRQQESLVKSANIIIHKKNLFVKAEELELLLTTSATSPKRTSEPESSQSCVKEKDKLLRQIAALALVFAEKGKAYQHGGKPNAKQIATAVETALDVLPNAERLGLSSTNIRASIAEGMKMLLE